MTADVLCQRSEEFHSVKLQFSREASYESRAPNEFAKRTRVPPWILLALLKLNNIDNPRHGHTGKVGSRRTADRDKRIKLPANSRRGTCAPRLAESETDSLQGLYRESCG